MLRTQNILAKYKQQIDQLKNDLYFEKEKRKELEDEVKRLKTNSKIKPNLITSSNRKPKMMTKRNHQTSKWSEE